MPKKEVIDDIITNITKIAHLFWTIEHLPINIEFETSKVKASLFDENICLDIILWWIFVH